MRNGRRICYIRVCNFRSSTSRNVVSASVSFPAQEVSSSHVELAASIFSEGHANRSWSYSDKEQHLLVAELTSELKWDMVYCSNPTSPGGSFRSGFRRLIVRNKVSFSALGFLDGQVPLKGKLIVLDEKWIKVVFEPPQLKLGSVEFHFGVQLEITYIDDKLRLGMGSRGSVFVFKGGDRL
ncbi:putative plastid-lipid-associated protein [Helianthus annuus]|nr:putative plastid-lipid-associated protein [Helianthus annuus]